MRHAFMLLCLAVASGACQYDLDKVYRHTVPDASTESDGALEGGSSSGVPTHLIDLFSSEAFVDDGCKDCANKKCSVPEAACRGDQACLDLTACAAEVVDPNKLSSCRAEQADWAADDVIGRALGGPFYACVFRDSCSKECDTPSDWSCRGKYSWETTPEASVPMRIRFAEAVNGTPAANLTVKVFYRIDEDLSNPASVQKTDADGLVELDLPTSLKSFRGYLQIEGEGWYPTLIKFGYPIARASVASILIVTEQNVEGSVFSAGATQSEDFGQLQLRMFGCAGVLMRDVSFACDKADPETSRTWYYDGNIANTSRTTTTIWGNGGIINVKPGVSQVTATLGSMLVAQTSAPVKPGFLTIVLLAPLDSSQL